MRYFVVAALAALTFGFFDARPASAAWQCIGPEYVCGGSMGDAPKKSWKAKTAHRIDKARRSASHGVASHKVAGHKAKSRGSRSVASSESFGGGSVGIASYYWQGQQTASGARFNPSAMTAAHRTLPFGTRVLVTHLASGRTVTVTINDRGPFIKGRIIDLSKGAAGVLGITSAGVARVQVAVLGRG